MISHRGSRSKMNRSGLVLWKSLACNTLFPLLFCSLLFMFTIHVAPSKFHSMQHWMMHCRDRIPDDVGRIFLLPQSVLKMLIGATNRVHVHHCLYNFSVRSSISTEGHAILRTSIFFHHYYFVTVINPISHHSPKHQNIRSMVRWDILYSASKIKWLLWLR